MPVAVIAVGIVLLILISSLSLGARMTAFLLAIVTTCLLPIALIEQPGPHHVGIAGPNPELRTFTIAFFAMALIAIMRYGTSVLNAWHLLFLTWVFWNASTNWTQSPLVTAGIIQLCIGLAAWVTGTAIARDFSNTNHKVRDRLTTLLAVVVFVEVAVCLLQFAGLPINALDSVESAILGDRVNGTANHPNNLGKLLIAVLVLLLPLSDRTGKSGRRAFLATLLLLVPLGLAQGRANIAAFVCTLILWTALSPAGRYTGRKLVIVVAVLSGLGGFATALLARFEEDPRGGVRNEIMTIATENMGTYWTTGAGPNNYVEEIASRFGSFIPVHNSFVLLLMETGLVGLILFICPLALGTARSLTTVRVNPYARVLIAVIPGLLAIGWTGWGLLGTSVLPMMFFVLAYTIGRADAWGRGAEGANPESAPHTITQSQVGSPAPYRLKQRPSGT